MRRTISRRVEHWLGLMAAVALFAACADEPTVGPYQPPTLGAQLGAPSTDAQVSAVTAVAFANGNRVVTLGECDDLRPPAGSTLAFRAYAKGVQIYSWNGTSWSFVAPSAVLSADPEGKSRVAIHYAGPTWESNSGSKVVGTVLKKCLADQSSIPWLSLTAVATDSAGVFRRVNFIQRVNTVGGIAPSAPGVTGDTARVPYASEYLFYRAP
jgi:Protein of unknown function (DUF3455)